LLARTSSIKSAFLFLCFPGFREEPFFLHQQTYCGRASGVLVVLLDQDHWRNGRRCYLPAD
ncbi:hypothetical protein RIV07_28980, partial [Pseudomonas baetica]|nr:hypothetical protein [Pseudomonas baetica]